MERAIRLGTLGLLIIALVLINWTLFLAGKAAPVTVPVPTVPNGVDSSVSPSPLIPVIDPPPPPSFVPEFIHPKSGRYVAAWMPTDWDTDNARASFEANLDFIDEVSPVWYDMRTNGTLDDLGGSRDRSLVEVAHSAGVLVMPSITNGFDPDRTGYVFNNAQRRAQFVQRILDEVDEYDLDGIDIDFEAMPDSQREEFTAFIRELASGLHSRGKFLAVAIHARTSENDGAPGAGAQDWYAIGQACDRFRIMTYDYHWRGGGPGPVAPIYWVEQVVEYAKTVVEPSKIIVGVPFYGYDWVGNDGAGVTWAEIQELKEIYEPKVNLLESDASGEVAESWFTYRARDGQHTVWFASVRSLEAKLDLVADYDLGGIAIWRLGGEDPAYWEATRERLSRDPFEVQRSVLRYLPDP